MWGRLLQTGTASGDVRSSPESEDDHGISWTSGRLTAQARASLVWGRPNYKSLYFSLFKLKWSKWRKILIEVSKTSSKTFWNFTKKTNDQVCQENINLSLVSETSYLFRWPEIVDTHFCRQHPSPTPIWSQNVHIYREFQWNHGRPKQQMHLQHWTLRQLLHLNQWLKVFATVSQNSPSILHQRKLSNQKSSHQKKITTFKISKFWFQNFN